MKPSSNSPPDDRAGQGSRWGSAIVTGCLLVLFFAILLPRAKQPLPPKPQTETAQATPKHLVAHLKNTTVFRSATLGTSASPSAEELLAARLRRFAQSRREIDRAIARRAGKTVPDAIEKFFDAVDAGDWDEIKKQFHELASHSSQYDYSTTPWPDINPYWEAVLDAYGAVEQAHILPAQKLLDYGNAALDSLRPGMVYVGGTDPGRFVVTMMNDTGDGEHHVVLTQNALADGRYLDYLTFLYGDQVSTLTSEDSQAAFQKYMDDAKQRLLHDQEFPNEPAQLRPGEKITIDPDTGKVNISGVTSVMAVNELLLQKFIQKNPDLSLAMEESFSLPSTYVNGAPLGSLIELNAQNPLTAESAAQSIAYWTQAANQAMADLPTSDELDAVKKMYSHEIASQGNLFAGNNYPDQAEQAYQLALQICPYSPDAASRYVDLLLGQNRQADALQVAQNALKAAPDDKKLQDLLTRVKQPIHSSATQPH